MQPKTLSLKKSKHLQVFSHHLVNALLFPKHLPNLLSNSQAALTGNILRTLLRTPAKAVRAQAVSSNKLWEEGCGKVYPVVGCEPGQWLDSLFDQSLDIYLTFHSLDELPRHQAQHPGR